MARPNVLEVPVYEAPIKGITNIGADLGAKRKSLHNKHVIGRFNKTRVFSDYDVDCSQVETTAYFSLKNRFTKSKSDFQSPNGFIKPESRRTPESWPLPPI